MAVHAEWERQAAWRRRIRRLSRIYHASFAATAAAMLGLCASGAPREGSPYLVFAALLVLCFASGFAAQALVWRTRCPECGHAFYARTWSIQHTRAGFPTDTRCAQCGWWSPR